MKAKLIIPAILVAVVATAAFGAISTFAQSKSDQQSTVIQKLAQKFGLKEDEVKAVFEEVKAQHQTQMQENFEERLNQAVSQGKITEDQKKLMLAKHEELQKEREADRERWQSMSPAEKQTEIQSRKQEMQNWASENGIDMQYFFGEFKGGIGKGWRTK